MFTEKVVDVVRYLNLAVPENLPKLILSVSDGNPWLSFAAIKSLCGLIFGKGPLLETSPKQKQVGTRRNYLENGNLTEDEAVLSFMRALEEHKKKCEKEGKYKEARTAAKRLADLKMHEEQKHKSDMRGRHEQEEADAQRAFAMEQEQHRHMWDLKVWDPSLTPIVMLAPPQHSSHSRQTRCKIGSCSVCRFGEPILAQPVGWRRCAALPPVLLETGNPRRGASKAYPRKRRNKAWTEPYRASAE